MSVDDAIIMIIHCPLKILRNRTYIGMLETGENREGHEREKERKKESKMERVCPR
jgi:hypothetical protein